MNTSQSQTNNPRSTSLLSSSSLSSSLNLDTPKMIFNKMVEKYLDPEFHPIINSIVSNIKFARSKICRDMDNIQRNITRLESAKQKEAKLVKRKFLSEDENKNLNLEIKRVENELIDKKISMLNNQKLALSKEKDDIFGTLEEESINKIIIDCIDKKVNTRSSYTSNTIRKEICSAMVNFIIWDDERINRARNAKHITTDVNAAFKKMFIERGILKTNKEATITTNDMNKDYDSEVEFLDESNDRKTNVIGKTSTSFI